MPARRCVVTGQVEGGRSVVVSDTMVDPVEVSLLPGFEFHRLWGSDNPPALPSEGTPPGQQRYFPPAGGYRFGFFTVGPVSSAPAPDIDIVSALDELDQRLPGLSEVMEPDQPGMHTTDTVDLDLVLSGEVWLELDDG